jgi:hypothetical protein
MLVDRDGTVQTILLGIILLNYYHLITKSTFLWLKSYPLLQLNRTQAFICCSPFSAAVPSYSFCVPDKLCCNKNQSSSCGSITTLVAANTVQGCSTEAGEIAVGLSGAVVCDLMAANKSCSTSRQQVISYITIFATYPETVFLTVRVKVASFNTPAAVGLNWNVTPGAQVKGVVGICWYIQFPEQATEPLGKATVKSMVELNLELSGQVPPGKPELLPMKWRSRLGTVHDSERVVRGRARAVEKRARDEKRVVACMLAYFQVGSDEEL